jgi:HKD family nuclease
MRYELHFQDPRVPTTRYFLEEILGELSQDRTTDWYGVFAFATAGGIDLVLDDPAVHDFLARGQTHLIVGIDAITDPKALRRLRDAADAHPGFTARVFTRGAGGLFHPKVARFVRDDGSQVVIVGSANLTSGGLRGNVEAYSVAEFDRDEVPAGALESWLAFETQRAEDFLEITDEVLEQAAANVRDRLIRRRRERPAEGAVEETLPPLEDAGEPDDRVLVAEVPKASDRWGQVHFNQDVVHDFFRVRHNSPQRLFLVHLERGTLVEEPPRPCVYSTRNKNMKVELAATHGLAYPAEGRPILVFREVGLRSFRYILLMPGDPGHAELDAFLAFRPSVGRGLRRVIATRPDVEGVWPALPI